MAAVLDPTNLSSNKTNKRRKNLKFSNKMKKKQGRPHCKRSTAYQTPETPAME